MLLPKLLERIFPFSYLPFKINFFYLPPGSIITCFSFFFFFGISEGISYVNDFEKNWSLSDVKICSDVLFTIFSYVVVRYFYRRFLLFRLFFFANGFNTLNLCRSSYLSVFFMNSFYSISTIFLFCLAFYIAIFLM